MTAGTDIARAEAPSTALAITSEQTAWTAHQLATLRHLGVENATDGDLDVFLHQVKRTGLDPFARQIYMVGRDENRQVNGQCVKTTKYTIQTGIDGFRLIARRAADAAGDVLSYEDTLWCGPDGRWTDVWLHQTPPAAAKVVVVRGHGQRYPAIATLAEYAGRKRDGGLTRMWQEKSALMLAKCAEALALRKAFPQDLSGLYTSDEMQAADRPHAVHAESTHEAEAPVEVGPDGLTAEQRTAVDTARDRVLACSDPDELRALWTQTHPQARAATTSLEPEYAAVLGLPPETTLGDVIKAACRYVTENGVSVDQGVALDPANDTPTQSDTTVPDAA